MRSAPDAILCAAGFGQAWRGLTRRSRPSPKFAMARAAAPIFSPSCGSNQNHHRTRRSTHRLVLSVPAPGICYSKPCGIGRRKLAEKRHPPATSAWTRLDPLPAGAIGTPSEVGVALSRRAPFHCQILNRF